AYRGTVAAPVQSSFPSMEPEFLQQQGWNIELTDDRGVQKRSRRVLRPGRLGWPIDIRSICHLRHYPGLGSLRTVLLLRRRQELGGKLDCQRHAGDPSKGFSAVRPITGRVELGLDAC